MHSDAASGWSYVNEAQDWTWSNNWAFMEQAKALPCLVLPCCLPHICSDNISTLNLPCLALLSLVNHVTAWPCCIHHFCSDNTSMLDLPCFGFAASWQTHQCFACLALPCLALPCFAPSITSVLTTTSTLFLGSISKMSTDVDTICNGMCYLCLKKKQKKTALCYMFL